MVNNINCYWMYEDIDMATQPPTIRYNCCFDAKETRPCEVNMVCLKYVDGNNLDDYIHGLLEEIDKLDEALTLYEEGLM